MTANVPEHIVVASDGTPAALRGVRYATFEAKRLGVGLEIVHVVPGYLPTGPLPMVPDGALQAFGRSVLKRSLAVARNTAGDVEIITRLVSGARVASIVDAGRSASLLVLGSRPHTLAERVWTGATAAGVSARARLPVVIVPEDWSVRDTASLSRVLVGFKSPQHAPELFARAFALANTGGADLAVLHAWKLPSVYDDVVTNRVSEARWREEQHAVIESLIVDLRRCYPEVAVTVDVVHEPPAHALVQASRNVDRLVITRPEHGGYFHHLGAVARAVLREAHCPVEVVPPVRVKKTSAVSRLEHDGRSPT